MTKKTKLKNKTYLTIPKLENIFKFKKTVKRPNKKLNTKNNITKTNKKSNDETKIYKQLRIPEGFPTQIKNSIDLIKLNNQLGLKPVGSFKYRIHSYPSDIDLFERYEDCCDLDQVLKKIKNKLIKIGKKLINDKKIYLGELKVGYDMDLFIDYGSIDYKTKKVINYNYQKIKEYLIKINNNKFITNEKYNQIDKLLKEKPTLLEFLEIHDVLRNLFILRWNINEMVQGYKVIRNKKVYLEDAIQHQTITKIDIWAPINNNYTEITNFYYIIFKNKRGEKSFLCKELTDYGASIDNDIYQYSSAEFRNSLKLAKRLWIKYNFSNNEKTLEVLYPLFNSGAAKLHQIKEELGVINDIIKRFLSKTDKTLNTNFKTNVLRIIKGQIEGFKFRVNDVFDIEVDYKKIFKLLDYDINIINSYYNKKGYTSKNLNKIIKNNKKISEILSIIIEDFSFNYLTKNNIVRLKKTKLGKEKQSFDKYTDLEVI